MKEAQALRNYEFKNPECEEIARLLMRLYVEVQKNPRKKAIQRLLRAKLKDVEIPTR